jgi:hypothetical protein
VFSRIRRQASIRRIIPPNESGRIVNGDVAAARFGKSKVYVWTET